MIAAILAAACSTTYEEPKLLSAPVYAQSVRAAAGDRSVEVVVTIAADGSVIRAEVSKSSGNTQVNEAVLNAARTAKYAPATFNCKPIANQFIFLANFAPPTPAPLCNFPEKEATVLNEQQAAFPESARSWIKQPVVSLIEVTVSDAGKVKAASIYKSSGNADLDKAAIAAARASTYAPRTSRCVPVEGVYLFRAEFAP